MYSKQQDVVRGDRNLGSAGPPNWIGWMNSYRQPNSARTGSGAQVMYPGPIHEWYYYFPEELVGILDYQQTAT